jgi:hypothetical protein
MSTPSQRHKQGVPSIQNEGRWSSGSSPQARSTQPQSPEVPLRAKLRDIAFFVTIQPGPVHRVVTIDSRLNLTSRHECLAAIRTIIWCYKRNVPSTAGTAFTPCSWPVGENEGWRNQSRERAVVLREIVATVRSTMGWRCQHGFRPSVRYHACKREWSLLRMPKTNKEQGFDKESLLPHWGRILRVLGCNVGHRPRRQRLRGGAASQGLVPRFLPI